MNQIKYEKLRQFYIDHFYQIEEQEDYKWEAVQHFQDNWKIEAENFPLMIEEAMRKNANLGASQKYNASLGILKAASKEPDSIRQLFRNLFNESIDLRERITNFKEKVNDIIKDCEGYKELHKQDVRAIILYLSLRYPEKYYLYKFDMYREFIMMVEGDKIAGDDIQRGLDFLKMCNDLKTIVASDTELLDLNEARRNRYTFPSDNLLIQDFIYSVYYYNDPKQLKPLSPKASKKNNRYSFEKPVDVILGEYDSWKTVNDDMAIIQTDKTFYDYKRFSVPKEVIWFFEASELQMGDRKNITLVYRGYEYTAYLKMEEAFWQTKIFWNTELGKKFNEKLNDAEYFPLCMFQRSGKNKYNISFVPGVVKKYEEALDDTHSADEMEIHAKQVDIDSLTYIAEQREMKEIQKKEVTTVQVTRDPYIAELAKRRANGICQLCLQQAPFNKLNGDPYLESHHIKWLANGGEDSIKNTVALCPNCHRKMHVVGEQKDIELLQIRGNLLK